MSRRLILVAIAAVAAAVLVLGRTDVESERAAAVERIARRAPVAPAASEIRPVPDLGHLTGDPQHDRPFWAEHGIRATDSVEQVHAIGVAFRERFPGTESQWPQTYCAMHTSTADIHDARVQAACAVDLLARFPDDPEVGRFAYGSAVLARDEGLARDIRFATGIGPLRPVFVGDGGTQHTLGRAWGGWLSVHAPSLQRELVAFGSRGGAGRMGAIAAIAGGIPACEARRDFVVCAP
ncbi:MAG: hypothetical protein H6737_14565 [Alphaproteobacteria bacterium]|nr:hypothetical protein [Alphaproteobacteria bacterium]